MRLYDRSLEEVCKKWARHKSSDIHHFDPSSTHRCEVLTDEMYSPTTGTHRRKVITVIDERFSPTRGTYRWRVLTDQMYLPMTGTHRREVLPWTLTEPSLRRWVERHLETAVWWCLHSDRDSSMVMPTQRQREQYGDAYTATERESNMVVPTQLQRQQYGDIYTAIEMTVWRCPHRDDNNCISIL